MSRLSYLQEKIVDLSTAQLRIQHWKFKGETVVFTNGCFDILHQGHVVYLAKAAALGTRLVVAINSDASVRQQNKGPERPINPESARAVVLAALGFVDLVVLFEGQTPIDLIEEFQPDVLVKGADYDPLERNPASKTYIVGSDEVLKYGGRVEVIELEAGFSTTNIVNKLK